MPIQYRIIYSTKLSCLFIKELVSCQSAIQETNTYSIVQLRLSKNQKLLQILKQGFEWNLKYGTKFSSKFCMLWYVFQHFEWTIWEKNLDVKNMLKDFYRPVFLMELYDCFFLIRQKLIVFTLQFNRNVIFFRKFFLYTTQWE
jgi:hypothetical protein